MTISVFTTFHLESTSLVFSFHTVYIQFIYTEKMDIYRPCLLVSAVVYLRNQIASDMETSGLPGWGNERNTRQWTAPQREVINVPICASNEDSDQPARMRNQNRIFAVRRRKKVYTTKTRLCSFDPLKPHFYSVKLEFTGVYINFIISAQNIDCGYSLEPPRRGGSNKYP